MPTLVAKVSPVKVVPPSIASKRASNAVSASCNTLIAPVEGSSIASKRASNVSSLVRCALVISVSTVPTLTARVLFPVSADPPSILSRRASKLVILPLRFVSLVAHYKS